MIDPDTLSDQELEAIASGDMAGFTRAAAERIGVRPDLALKVRHQESRGEQGAVSPKGARGSFQLMPDTAAELGVDPDDEIENTIGGLTYLKRQIDDFGDERLALAAYNAGPGAVREHGGVPPFKETQAYVSSILGGDEPADVAQMSDAELEAIANGGNVIEGEHRVVADRPPPKAAPRIPAKAAKGVPTRPAANDAALGLASGLQKGGASVADSVIQASPVGTFLSVLQGAGSLASLMRGEGGGKIPAPVSLHADIAARNGYTPQTKGGRFAEAVGTMIPNATIPGSAVARGLNVVLPAVGDEVAQDIAEIFGAGEKGQKIAGVAGSVVGGGAASLRGVPKLDTMKVKDLPKAVDDAYAKVRASGVTFPKDAVHALADDFAAAVKSTALGKEAKDNARSLIGYVRGLTKEEGDQLPLDQLDRLRSDIHDVLMTKGGDAARLGKAFRDKIDALIGPNPDLEAARALNTRLAKVKTVQTKVDSAKLGVKNTVSRNVRGKIQGKLRPLIDPDSPQEVFNWTPDELKAVSKIVNGGGLGEKAAGLTGAMADPRRLLSIPGLIAALGAAPHTAGLSLGLPGVGLAGSMAANLASKKGVQDLARMIAAGGKATPRIPVRIAPGTYSGAAAVTAPLLAAAPAAAQPKRQRPSPR